MTLNVAALWCVCVWGLGRGCGEASCGQWVSLSPKQTDRQTDGWTNKKTDIYIYIYIYTCAETFKKIEGGPYLINLTPRAAAEQAVPPAKVI